MADRFAYDPSKLLSVATANSVTSRLESLIGRLEKAEHRISGLADQILGPSPLPANDAEATRDCIKRGIDRAHELVNAIESELDRLGDQL